ncbi:MAG TPA: hypothetical protein VH062_00405 [Polyangiaceae bacterium]|nr:hypothetical protein [Polyangiaceae bacterium]
MVEAEVYKIRDVAVRRVVIEMVNLTVADPGGSPATGSHMQHLRSTASITSVAVRSETFFLFATA